MCPTAQPPSSARTWNCQSMIMLNVTLTEWNDLSLPMEHRASCSAAMRQMQDPITRLAVLCVFLGGGIKNEGTTFANRPFPAYPWQRHRTGYFEDYSLHGYWLQDRLRRRCLVPEHCWAPRCLLLRRSWDRYALPGCSLELYSRKRSSVLYWSLIAASWPCLSRHLSFAACS